MVAVPALDWAHETVLAADPVSASQARDFVCLHLNAHHLPHLVEDMRLVVSELATNAVTHAQTPFLVTLAKEDGSVRLMVQDQSTSVPVMGHPDLLDMGGRGLILVEPLSEDWGTSTDGDGVKSVWASFPSRQPDPTLPRRSV